MTTFGGRIRRSGLWPVNPTAVLWAAVAFSALLGLTRFNRFGESWDEQLDFRYGEDAAAHYAASPEFWDEYDQLKYYGPAYLAPAGSVATYLRPLVPDWEPTDARHFVNHLTFQIATIALYFLCRRTMGGWPALGAALMFASQPVLFGHSFINQKDIPFMTAYLLAAALGLALSDRSGGLQVAPQADRMTIWQRLPRLTRLALIGTAVVSGLLCLELLVFKAVLLPAVLRLVAEAYADMSLPAVNAWFDRLAEASARLPLDYYLMKTNLLYLGLRWGLAGLAAVPLIVLAARAFRPELSRWWASRGGTLALALATGAVAGLATATRVVGVSLLGLVGLPGLLRRRLAGVPVLAAAGVAAAAACYGAWPYLHGAPFDRLWESLTVMSRYPWGGKLVYLGELTEPDRLPWHYLPTLLGVQLTLPTLLLMLVGLAGAIWHPARRGRPEVVTLLVWLSAPLLAVVLLRSTLYDNFRQLLFILPPVFVFAGIGLDMVFARIRSTAVRGLLVAAALAPGIAGIVRLHPYEYVYYNAVVGGVAGAAASFETDYWCTSYRQAMDWINEHAPANADVAAGQPAHLAAGLARPDLRLLVADEPGDVDGSRAVYWLGCSHGAAGLAASGSWPLAAQVSAAGVPLAVVLDLRPGAGAAQGP